MWQKMSLSKDLQKSNSSGIIQVDPKCRHMYPCKTDSETLEVDRWKRGDMMVEQREMQPGAKESQQPLEGFHFLC